MKKIVSLFLALLLSSPLEARQQDQRLPFLTGGYAPTVSVDFTKTGSTLPSSNFSYSGPSLKTITDANGYVTYAPNNLLMYSSTLTNASWLTSFGSLSANGTAPSGAAAYSFTPDTSSNIHRFYYSIGGTVGTNYYLTCILKGNGVRYVYINAGALFGAALTIDLNTGSYVTSGASISSVSVTSLPNGFWSVAFKGVSTTNNTFFIQANTSLVATDNTYAGDGTSNFIASQFTLSAVTYETTPRPGDQVITTSAAFYGPAFDYQAGTYAANNILTYSNTFNNAVWVNGTTTVTPGQPDPFGGTNASTLASGAGGGSINNTNNVVPSPNFIASIWAQGTSGTAAALTLYDATTSSTLSAISINFTSTWTQFSVKVTGATQGHGLFFIINPGVGNVQNTVNVYGATFSAVTTETTPRAGDQVITTASPYYANGSFLTFLTTPLGLRVEESRTDYIRNNTMQGVAAGTPGTVPTNWQQNTNGNGLSKQIVGSGTVNGINYVDMRFFGTTTGTQGNTIYFDQATAIPATNGQAWTTSVYVALVGGSFTNINTGATFIEADQNNSSGTFLSLLVGSTISISPTLTRFTQTLTTNNASISYINPNIIINTSGSGLAVDFTLRIGMPQQEIGSFSTSLIPTAASSATRAADVVSIIGPALGVLQGRAASAIAEFNTSGRSINSARIIGTNNASTSDLLDVNGTSGTSMGSYNGSAYLTTANLGGNSLLTSTIRAGISYVTSGGSRNISGGGGAVASDAAAITTVSPVSSFLVGSSNGLANFLDGHVTKLALWNRALPNAKLQAFTVLGAPFQ